MRGGKRIKLEIMYVNNSNGKQEKKKIEIKIKMRSKTLQTKITKEKKTVFYCHITKRRENNRKILLKTKKKKAQKFT